MARWLVTLLLCCCSVSAAAQQRETGVVSTCAAPPRGPAADEPILWQEKSGVIRADAERELFIWIIPEAFNAARDDIDATSIVHFHTLEHTLMILDGAYEFLVGKGRYDANQGALISFPARAIHGRKLRTRTGALLVLDSPRSEAIYHTTDAEYGDIWDSEPDEFVLDPPRVLKDLRETLAQAPVIRTPTSASYAYYQTDRKRILLTRYDMVTEAPAAARFHPDAEHSFVVISGTVNYEVGCGHTGTLEARDYISVPKGVRFKFYSLDADAYVVEFDAPFYDPRLTETIAEP